MAITRQFALVGKFEDFTHKKPTSQFEVGGYSSPFKEMIIGYLKGSKIHYVRDPIAYNPCQMIGAVEKADFNLCQIYTQLANEQMYKTRGEVAILSLYSLIDAYAEYVMHYKRKAWLEAVVAHHAKQYELVLYYKDTNDKYDKLVRRFLHDWKIEWCPVTNAERGVQVLNERLATLIEMDGQQTKPVSDDSIADSK